MNCDRVLALLVGSKNQLIGCGTSVTTVCRSYFHRSAKRRCQMILERNLERVAPAQCFFSSYAGRGRDAFDLYRRDDWQSEFRVQREFSTIEVDKGGSFEMFAKEKAIIEMFFLRNC